MRRRGLTLVDVLVIIALIAFLLIAMVPTLSRQGYERACRSKCMNHLREIGKACAMYAADYGGYYPTVRLKGTTTTKPLASLALLYDKYVQNPEAFTCPGTSDRCVDLAVGQTFRPHNSFTARHHGQFGCFHGTDEPRRECSYAYDDTRGPKTSSDIVIAGDAPPADLGLQDPGRKTSKNSDNHECVVQNILLYGTDTVISITRTVNPMIPGDDIYTAADPANPGESDSYIHQ